MPQTKLHDERAAFDLLTAIVRQARKDIAHKHIPPEARVDALEFFASLRDLHAKKPPADNARRVTGRARTRARTRGNVQTAAGGRTARRALAGTTTTTTGGGTR